MRKKKKPIWVTFRKVSEENLAKLPRKKPPCVKKAHNFIIKQEGTDELGLGKCRWCHIRWIFRTYQPKVWRSDKTNS